jgi:hypothetical protein
MSLCEMVGRSTVGIPAEVTCWSGVLPDREDLETDDSHIVLIHVMYNFRYAVRECVSSLQSLTLYIRSSHQ